MYEVNKAIAKAKRDSLIYRLCGGFLQWIFVVLWAISVIMLITGDGNWIVMIAFFLLIGVFKNSHDKGVALKKLISIYDMYCEHLEGEFLISVEDFAVSVSQSQDEVIKCLELMIKQRFINRVELSDNKENKTVYIHNHGIIIPIPKPVVNKNMVSATCNACCGITEVPEGEAGICAYCGSKIHG